MRYFALIASGILLILLGFLSHCVINYGFPLVPFEIRVAWHHWVFHPLVATHLFGIVVILAGLAGLIRQRNIGTTIVTVNILFGALWSIGRFATMYTLGGLRWWEQCIPILYGLVCIVAMSRRSVVGRAMMHSGLLTILVTANFVGESIAVQFDSGFLNVGIGMWSTGLTLGLIAILISVEFVPSKESTNDAFEVILPDDEPRPTD